jgi:hypothetical protein
MKLFREFINKKRPELIQYTSISRFRVTGSKLKQMYKNILTNHEISILHGQYHLYRINKMNNFNKVHIDLPKIEIPIR